MTTVRVRRRRPGYHRAAGRTLVAGSALGMTLMYPQEGTGDVLYQFRLAFSTAMVASIVLGFINLAVAEWAVRRRPAPRRRPQPAVMGAQP